MSKFEISGTDFLYDGKPVKILSGAIHYFRIVPEYWKDRLLKLKACGFNTVETYIAWNMHEPREGEFCFEGICDIERFVRTAGELGLFVIVRPSPYICAEWEFGGLPAWLLSYPDMKLRCNYKPYLDKVDAYYDALIPKLLPYLCTNGGPIIAMQIENEYGSYGADKEYLQHIKEALKKRGVDVLLFTSDGPTDMMLQGGTLPDVFKTVNFGSRHEEAFAKLKEYQNDKPLMCTEFWNGWFDHWGEEHHTRGHEDTVREFDGMLKYGASVNFYMFHGGTNFGFMNGANHSDSYEPTVTSYDYDAPLNESGDPTPKYYAVRDVLSKYVEIDHSIKVEPSLKKSYGEARMTQQADLFDSLDKLSEPMERVCPEPMEKLGQNYGFILYRTQLKGYKGHLPLEIKDVHDRALIFLNGKYVDVIYRNDKDKRVFLDLSGGSSTLDILVENMGRVNYGPFLKDHKGITEHVRLDYHFLFGWTIYPLPMDDLSKLCFDDAKVPRTTSFYRGTFNVDEMADTFLSLDGWVKGAVWINGFNIGRYWNVGPQKTLYVPAPLLKKSENEIIIFEVHEPQNLTVKFTDKPDLG